MFGSTGGKAQIEKYLQGMEACKQQTANRHEFKFVDRRVTLAEKIKLNIWYQKHKKKSQIIELQKPIKSNTRKQAHCFASEPLVVIND